MIKKKLLPALLMGASFVLTGCGGGDNGSSSSLTDNRFVEEKNKLESSFKEIKNKEIALQYDLDQAKQDASREGDQLQKELDKVEAFKEANSSAKQYFDEVRKLEKVQKEIGAALDQGKELISKFQTSVNVVNINNNLTLVNNQSATLQVNVEAAQLSVKNAMGVLQKNFVMLLPMDRKPS